MISCRDCSYQLDANARGCPRCARNIEAEEMIDRLVWRCVVPLLIVLLLAGAGAIVWLRR